MNISGGRRRGQERGSRSERFSDKSSFHRPWPQRFCYADHEQAWTAHVSAGPLQKVVEIAGPDAVRQVLRDVLEADRKPDGDLRQDNVFRYVVATKE
jgi:hypothetical protein